MNYLEDMFSRTFLPNKKNVNRKKEILDDVLRYFVQTKTYPKVDKFEADNLSDIKIIQSLIKDGYLTQKNEYWLYSLTLEGLLFIRSPRSVKIVNVIDSLITDLKQLYVKDVEAYHSIAELASKLEFTEDEIIVALELMKYTGCNGGTITNEQTKLPKSVKASHGIIDMTNLTAYVADMKAREKKREFWSKIYGRYVPAIKEHFNPTLTLLVSIVTLCILVYSTFFQKTGG